MPAYSYQNATMPHSPSDTLLVIFGATGDLAKRKLVPALFSLYGQDAALEHVSILAIGRKSFKSEEFRTYLREESLMEAGSAGRGEGFLEKIEYLSLPIDDPAGYGPLREFAESHPQKNVVFYLSVPPELFEPVIS